jgi:hypothetical protein
MTKLEMSAVLLANEVERCLRLGLTLTSQTVLALNEFRKLQGNVSTLDALIRQVQNTENCPVIDIYAARKAKKDLENK